MKWSLLELRRQSRSPWRARILTAIAVVLVLWVLVGFFVVPPVLRSQAEKRLSHSLQRAVSIERIRTNPLTLSLRVEGLVVKEKDGSDFASFRSLFVNFSAWSRLAGSWKFQEISLDGFTGRVTVNAAGQLNLADLLPPSGPEKESADTSARSTPVAIGRLQVSDARLHFSDASQGTPFVTEIGPLTFSLRDFRSTGDPRAAHEFTAATESGETVTWRGAVSHQPLRSEGEFSIQGVSLPKYAPYYAPRIAFSIPSGLASFSARYAASLNQAVVLRLTGGDLTLKDFKAVTLTDRSALVALPDLHVTGIDADLQSRSVSLGRVSAKGGRLDVRRSAAGIDLLKAVQPVAGTPSVPTPAAPAPSTPAGAGAPLQLTLGGLEASGLAVHFTDSTPPRPVAAALENLSLKLGRASWPATREAIPLTLGAQLTGGGSVALDGTVALAPVQTQLALKLEGASIALVSPYLESHLDLWLAKGRAEVQGKASTGPQGLSFEGDAAISEVVALDNQADEEFTSWSKLSLQGIRYSGAENQVSIGTITWADPSVRLVNAREGGLNVTRLRRLPTTAAPAPPPGRPSPSSLQVKIDRVRLDGGRLSFTDLAQQPAVKASLTGFSGDITGLSSDPRTQANVELSGKLDDSAPVSLKGRMSPLAQPASADLSFDLRGADLTPTGPYIARYAGYALERGALSLAVKLRLADRRIESSDVATLDQFTLGAKTDSPDATKLPVGLAIALLKDRSGQIVIDVPIQGNLDDPEFRIGRVVWRVIGNLLTKVATSPFALLGAAFGGGGEELATQIFAPGSAELAATEQSKVATIARALVERPALRLELSGHYDPGADREALRQAEFDQLIERTVLARRRAAGAPTDNPPVTEPEQVAALAQLFAEAFPEVVAAQAAAAAQTSPSASTPEPEPVGLLPRLVRFLSGRSATPAPAEANTPAPSPSPAASSVAATAPTAVSLETMAERILGTLTIDDVQLSELAIARAQRVRARLLETPGIAPERITLAGAKAGGSQVSLALK